MTDLDRPLSEQLSSADERRVLESIRLDVPTSEGAKRSAALLGLPPAAADFGGGALLGTQAATGAAVGGVVVVAALIGAFVLLDHEPAPPPRVAPPVEVVSAPKPNDAGAEPAEEPAASAEVAKSSEPAAAEPSKARVAVSQVKPTLEDQLARMDRARTALGRGDGQAALSEVAKYRSAYPKGALLQEASVIRILSLEQLGRTSEARAEAKRFLTQHPTSPHAARLERLTRTDGAAAPGGAQ